MTGEMGRDDDVSFQSGMLEADPAAAKKAHMATKRRIPLYIGLATGFCGSLTTFSSFIRDVNLALFNDLPNTDEDAAAPRNGGQSFMALLAVVILTVSLSLSGLFLGAHIAVALESAAPPLPRLFDRKFIDRIAVTLAWGCWLGAVLLSVMPPDRDSASPETWRGGATFALVFAPVGCLCRFYASQYLNSRLETFPLGTFVVNVLGTSVLAMAWDLAHVPYGAVIGCQVLQGIEDGFCGCLTTVSTWVTELTTLKRWHAYFYGAMSVLVSLAISVAIMGGLRWSKGFAGLLCVH
jgi:fluoride ion exporter CrcB/FEX